MVAGCLEIVSAVVHISGAFLLPVSVAVGVLNVFGYVVTGVMVLFLRHGLRVSMVRNLPLDA